MKHRNQSFSILTMILILVFLITPIKANEVTLEITNYINDYANVISEDTEQDLNQKGKDLEERTGAQVIFITTNSLNGQDIRQVAYHTFNKYKLGDDNKNNGVLFIVSLEDKQRYMEVGTGLEDTLTDIKSQHLQTDYLVPYFKKQEYEKGLVELYTQTTNILLNTDASAAIEANKETESTISYIYLLPIGCILLLVFIYAFTNSKKHPKTLYLSRNQKYRLDFAGYDFDNDTILVSSDNQNIVSVQPNGWIHACHLGKTYIHIQKISEKTVLDIPVIVQEYKNSNTDDHDDGFLDILLWSSMGSNYFNSHSSGNFSDGGFSGGGGTSRGGGAGGNW